jgi:hypothetical protein
VRTFFIAAFVEVASLEVVSLEAVAVFFAAAFFAVAFPLEVLPAEAFLVEFFRTGFFAAFDFTLRRGVPFLVLFFAGPALVALGVIAAAVRERGARRAAERAMIRTPLGLEDER